MKLLMLVVVFDLTVFSYAEACKYYIHSEALDSFKVTVSDNQNATIRSLISNTLVNPAEIEDHRPGSGGKGGVRCTKRYEVKFADGYVPPRGEEPFISINNDKCEFKLVFANEYYVELHSDMASEIHDDPERREYDRLHAKDELVQYGREVCSHNVRHWMVVGPYMVICCYEAEYFPRRCIFICESLDDNSWIKSTNEADCDSILRVAPPLKCFPQTKKRRWYELCCDCDD